MAVPGPVRRLFEAFPLETKPPIEVDNRGVDEADGPLTLYVYNLSDDGVCTDPEGLECQAVFRRNQQKPLVLTSSLHVCPKGRLPYIVEKQREKVRVYNEAKSINGNVVKQGQVYLTLIKVALGDAWKMTLLDPENEQIKRTLYGCDREAELLRPFASKEITQTFLTQLESRHALFVGHCRSWLFNWPAPLVETTYAETMEQADECLDVFETLLGDQQFIHDDRLGHEDILLFSYIYLITTYLASSPLNELVQRRPSLVTHSKNVYKALFNL